MICNNCNSQLPDGAQFCNYCGTSFYSIGQTQNPYYFQQQQGVSGYSQPGYNTIPPQPSKKNTGLIIGIIIGVILLIVIIIAIIILLRNDHNDTQNNNNHNTEYAGTNDDYENPFTTSNTTAEATTEPTTTEAITTEAITTEAITTEANADEATSSHNYDGTYVLSYFESPGLSYTVEELEEMTGENFYMSLIVTGSECTLDCKAMGYDKTSCNIYIEGTNVTLDDGADRLTGIYDPEMQSITITSSDIYMTFIKTQTTDDTSTTNPTEDELNDESYNYDGTYKLVGCEFLDMYYSVEEMEEMAGVSYDYTLTINGNHCTLESDSDSGEGYIEIDGEEITITDDNATTYGTYDKDTKTITLTVEDIDMIFEKTE